MKIKYILCLLLIMASLVTLAGCNGFLFGIPETQKTAQAAHQSPLTGQNDPATLANLEVMLDKVEHSVFEIEVTSTTPTIFGETVQDMGSGSAWAIDSNGTLVTNQHVIEGATTITAISIDGKAYPAEVVNEDFDSDIAVLKIDARDIPFLEFGDASKLRVGTWVVCVGNPLGEGISAKQGIVSRLGVTIPYSYTQSYHNMIEVSCAINPGNSGGPLVNLAGEVVGMTTLKVSDVGIEGMGYASSMTYAVPIIQKLSAGK